MDGRCNPMEVLVRPGHYPGTLPTLGYLPIPILLLAPGPPSTYRPLPTSFPVSGVPIYSRRASSSRGLHGYRTIMVWRSSGSIFHSRSPLPSIPLVPVLLGRGLRPIRNHYSLVLHVYPMVPMVYLLLVIQSIGGRYPMVGIGV